VCCRSCASLMRDVVVGYLQETCRVPLRRILTPAGMGTSQAIAANTTAEGRAENRRVEVKLIVNKAMADK
jgi:outer membrane protein OmpA-like peptidoglycan-associated protein